MPHVPGGKLCSVDRPYSMRTFGAVFAEVTVDPTPVSSGSGAASASTNAGRIINTKTAASQMTGGIIWGYGQAVLEEIAVEPSYGAYLSKNLAGVTLPVSADIADLEVALVEDHDPHASAIGELGAVGALPAVGNSIFLRHFGMKTTWYLQSHVVWLAASGKDMPVLAPRAVRAVR